MKQCACCGTTFRPGELQCYSGLYTGAAGEYGEHHILLCESCSEVEEEVVERHGTNDLPELLATYIHR